MEERFNLLKEYCEEWGHPLTARMEEQFLLFWQMLVEKNKVMNLTGITEFHEVEIKHFLDSISVVKAVDFDKVEKVLDLGTGAGFPGIPLKILFPEKEFILADSLNKRLKFLDEVIEACGLEHIKTLHGRAEDLGRSKEYREKADLVVSRAVANLSSLSEYCLPLARKGGAFVSYKSGSVEEELVQAQRAIGLLGGEVNQTVQLTLPGDIGRTLIRIDKVRQTPAKYPRKAGVPGKEPL